jgi:nicotinamide riboside kinase
MEKSLLQSGNIAFTGPECSGKTTLSRWLALQTGRPWVAEYARKFLATRADYTWTDVQHIGEQQFKQNHALTHPICDTEMTVIRIWERVKFGSISTKTQQLTSEDNYDFLFLCKPDFPWVSDPLREHPEERDALFRYYEEDLQNRGTKYHVLEGQLTLRQAQIFHVLS